MRTAAAIVLALLLGTLSSVARASVPAETSSDPAPEYDLAACTAPEDIDEELGAREAGLALPRVLEGVVKSNLYHFVVPTLEGGTVCVDTSWMGGIEDARAEGRFLSSEWWGYETFGHILVDRAGAGTVVDTGQAPVISPSGKLVAGLQVSEAGWGGLEGFAIWNVTPAGLTRHFTLTADADGLLPEVFRQEMALWRIESWVGEHCLAISAASWAALETVGEDVESAERTPFRARRSEGWEIKPGPVEDCPQS